VFGSGKPQLGITTPQVVTNKSNQSNITVPTNLSDVRIMMPRGDKVIVSWDGMPKDQPGDSVLRKAGIDTDEIDAGTKVAYAALMKRSAESIRYAPLIFGIEESKPKLANGYAHAVMHAGPSDDAGYKELQLFQRADEFIILVDPITEKLPVVPPDKLGIEWDKVRQGLQRALKAIYRNSKTVEFEGVDILTHGDGSWEYRLPCHVRSPDPG
jgi:hypothetical protein